MPPGTGDVQLLTLGQPVQDEAVVIVSTSQDVTLIDARKGVAVFCKVHVLILGLLLNVAHFTCSTCSTPHYIIGPLTSFYQTSDSDTSNLKILGELPIIPSVSADEQSGPPTTLMSGLTGKGVVDVQSVMDGVTKTVLQAVAAEGL